MICDSYRTSGDLEKFSKCDIDKEERGRDHQCGCTEFLRMSRACMCCDNLFVFVLLRLLYTIKFQELETRMCLVRGVSSIALTPTVKVLPSTECFKALATRGPRFAHLRGSVKIEALVAGGFTPPRPFCSFRN